MKSELGEKAKRTLGRWLPGMRSMGHMGAGRVIKVVKSGNYYVVKEVREVDGFRRAELHTPDVDDDATLGCLLGAAKTLSGDPTVSVWYVSGYGWAWRVGMYQGEFQPEYKDAVVCALERARLNHV